MKYLFLPAFFIPILFFSCTTNLPQLPEEESNIILTSTLQLQDETYCQRIDDFYNRGTEKTFIGENGVPIFCKLFEQQIRPSAAIIISSGRTESTLKYKELIFDLFNNGYSVYIHDHRGQGQSGRMTEDPEMGFIDSFQYYINDMKYFYDTCVQPGNHLKIYLLAHSMGGAIGMTYLEQHPSDFNAAAFSSPMLGLKSYACPLARILRGKEPEYGPGQTGYNREANIFEGNILTGSEIRYRRSVAVYDQTPETRLGGATIQWAKSSCRQFKYIFKHIQNIETPFILFSAQNEQLVNPHAHRKFAEKAHSMGKECEAYMVKDAQHELLMEKDQQRNGVISATLKFFAKY